jgi:hypothetical protein
LEYSGAGKLAPAPVTSWAADKAANDTVATPITAITEALRLNFIETPLGLVEKMA